MAVRTPWFLRCAVAILICTSAPSAAYNSHSNEPWDGGYNYQRRIPRDVMVSVINNMGLALLEVHSEHNENNVAISPYGATSVLVALVEGLIGDAAYEIKYAINLPQELAVVRVGLRDIHRHLKSYFIPKEGFLAGLTLSHDNITLNREYESILRFYGYDVESFNNPVYPEPFSTTQRLFSTTEESVTTTEMTTTDSGVTTTMMTTTDEALTTDKTSASTDTLSGIKPERTTRKEDETTMSTTSNTKVPDVDTESSSTTKKVPTRDTTNSESTEDIMKAETKYTTPLDGLTTEVTMITTELVVSTEPAIMKTESNLVIDTTTTNAPTTTTAPTTMDVTTMTQPATTEIIEDNEVEESKMTENAETTTTEAISTTELATTVVTLDLSDLLETSNNMIEITANITAPKRRKRSVVDYLIARYYDNYYINSNNNRRYLPPPHYPSYHPEAPYTFLVNGKFREPNISFMTYDTVLPFYYIPGLDAMALSFPLDSNMYYLLLVLPTDEQGIDKLIRNFRKVTTLERIVQNLKYTHVKAVIPSFMLKGYVVLTPSLQKLCIRKIFEPRQADFSQLTSEKDIYVTNIEQAVTVNIRNYMDPASTSGRSFEPYRAVEFKADHPFLYFVMDAQIHVNLMAGKIVNPLNSRIR